LHPKAQAALGDVFFELAIGNSGKRFLVETHSDYIINRFRQQKNQGKNPVRVFYSSCAATERITSIQSLLMKKGTATPIIRKSSEHSLSPKL
jgi:predicted ATPase